jgi:hypothetical protein
MKVFKKIISFIVFALIFFFGLTVHAFDNNLALEANLDNSQLNVSVGGYCVIDDYALTGCRLAVTEYLASIGESPEIITIEGGGGPVYWRRP